VAQNRRITRALYAVFVTGSAAFILSSVYQIAAAVFLPPKDASGAHARVGSACAAGIRELASGVDHALSAAGSTPNASDPGAAYATARDASWAKKDDLLRPCESDPVGPEAMAALARLDRMAESNVRRQSSEFVPVRREVDSFIRLNPQ
jgi:hypothetical protein